MIFEEMLKEERAEGHAEGCASALQETLILFLQNFGEVPDELSNDIKKQQDIAVLKTWMQTAFQSKTLEEFIQKM